MLHRLCRLPGCWPDLLLLALLAARPAAAQQAGPPAPADTSAAVRRLFAEHRSGNRARLISSGFLVIFANYGLAYAKQETTLQQVGTGVTIGVLAYEVFALGQALTWQRRYSPAREQAALALLAQGQPLPRQVRRHLRPQYFATPPAAR